MSKNMVKNSIILFIVLSLIMSMVISSIPIAIPSVYSSSSDATRLNPSSLEISTEPVNTDTKKIRVGDIELLYLHAFYLGSLTARTSTFSILGGCAKSSDAISVNAAATRPER